MTDRHWVAGWIGRATETLAARVGEGPGGLRKRHCLVNGF
jgi:Ca2+/H+ antiporter